MTRAVLYSEGRIDWLSLEGRGWLVSVVLEQQATDETHGENKTRVSSAKTTQETLVKRTQTRGYMGRQTQAKPA